MLQLLLDSSVSDNLELEVDEDLYPSYGLEDRVIEYIVPELDEEALSEHLGQQDKLESLGDYERAVGEFYVDEFFFDLEEHSGIDRTEYVTGPEEGSLKRKGFTYKFVDDETKVRVHGREGGVFTQLSRVVELQRKNMRHVVVPTLHFTSYEQDYSVKKKVKAAHELMEGKYALSIMKTYSIDIFENSLESDRRHHKSNSNLSEVEGFLNSHDKNLVAVFSIESSELEDIAEQAAKGVIKS